jgi:hypothetical protein
MRCRGMIQSCSGVLATRHSFESIIAHSLKMLLDE